MESFKVSKILTPELRVEDLSVILDKSNIGFQTIGSVNWKEFPYTPKTVFRIAHNGLSLLLHFRVCEATVRAKAGMDNGPVWEDSCVEFFSIPADDGIYYNLECSCIGKILVEAGRDREHRRCAPQTILDMVQRWSSLGNQTFEESLAPVQWDLHLIIPREIFFLSDVHSWDKLKIKANFYKCGDKMSTAHFLSYFPIASEKPDFHRPECFGILEFE